MKLDRTDRKILNAMQVNARISNLELADKVGLSATPCSRRVKRLEDSGLIRGHVTLLDQTKLGLKLTAYIGISMDRHTPDRFEAFESEVEMYVARHLKGSDHVKLSDDEQSALAWLQSGASGGARATQSVNFPSTY